MSLRSPKPLLATLLALALGAAACGGADSASNLAAAPATADTDAASQEPAPATAVNQLPDVNVIDVASGDEINLAGFAPSDKPIVLWFWAPH